jgi:phenylalanyl-tRNA synthetase alpha chain
MERIEAIFGSMGFEVADGPEIESDWFNFTALNTPEDHPARSMHDTFYVEGGSEKAPNLLRTHTSPMQIRHAVQHVKRHKALAGAPADGLFSGRDARDPRHRPGPHLPGRQRRHPFAHVPPVRRPVDRRERELQRPEVCLYRLLPHLLRIGRLVLRFRPSFFPFTEPSAEIDIQFQTGPLAGRWLEVAGSGQVHPNVVRNMGLDPEKYIGFAFGMGPDRLTMLRYGVNDLRLFFDGDFAS